MQGTHGTTSAPNAFDAGLTRGLWRAGLRGSPVRVELAGVTLTLRGARSGHLELRPADVVRMRVGSEDLRSRHYVWRLWRADGRERPLLVVPMRRGQPGYDASVRGFASALAEDGGLARVETGLSRAAALFLPVAFGALLLAAVWIALFLLANEPWWGRLLAPLVPGAVFVVGVRLAVTRYWPRAVTSLADLERHLA